MTHPNEMRVDEPRADGTPEWEVFLRSDESEPLRHVGSVSAATKSVAYEQARTLFGWGAHTLWLCPAAEVARYTDRDMGEAGPADGGERTDAVGGDETAVETDKSGESTANAAETGDGTTNAAETGDATADATGGESP